MSSHDDSQHSGMSEPQDSATSMPDDKKMDGMPMPMSDDKGVKMDAAPSGDAHAGMKMDMPMPTSDEGPGAEMDYGGMGMAMTAATRATGAQKAAVGFISAVALVRASSCLRRTPTCD